MHGFQAGNVDAIRSGHVVCVVTAGDLRVKAFQIVFGGDGSLFITFPYSRHRTGILSASAIPATGTRQSQVNLEQGGKVTSHLVKYSHHTDGRAHFSQTGKIVTVFAQNDRRTSEWSIDWSDEVYLSWTANCAVLLHQ